MLPLCGFPFRPTESLTNPSLVWHCPALITCLIEAIKYLPPINLSVVTSSPCSVDGESIKTMSPACKEKSPKISI